MDDLRSQTCAFDAKVAKGKSPLDAAQATQAQAVKQLGGSAGLTLVSFTERDDGARVQVTWRREWRDAGPRLAARAAAKLQPATAGASKAASKRKRAK